MKKFLSILFSAVIVSGCACALAACGGKQPVEQTNNMTIKSVSQNVYGSVVVTVDVSAVDFSADGNGNEKYYYVQPSLDGGQTWYERTAYLAQSEVKNGEFSFDVIRYESGDGNYYLLGSIDEESKLSLSAGDKIDISLRFAALDNYLVSEATQSVEYTIKGVAQIEIDGTSCGENLPFGGDTRYIFRLQQDGSFEFSKLICFTNDGGEADVKLEAPEAEILNRLEYKFITQDDLEEIGSMLVINTELKELENSTQTSGWVAYSAENGITSNDYNDSLISVERTDGANNIEEEYALIMVRLKETDGETKSAVSLVYLFTKSVWTEIN